MKRNYEIRIGGSIATSCHDSEYREKAIRQYGSRAAARRYAKSLCFAWGAAKVVEIKVEDINKINLDEYYDLETEEFHNLES